MEGGTQVRAETAAAYAWGPVSENRPARSNAATLKVVAFNSRGGRHLDEVIERFYRPPLNDPDIILLCEADWGLKRSGRCEMAADIASALNMSFVFIGEFGVRRHDGVQPGAYMGNAILSSRPMTDIKPFAVPEGFLRRRLRYSGSPAGLTAQISVNGKPVTVGVAHLNSRWNPAGRDLQMETVLRYFPQGGAAILGGDLNTTTLNLRTSRAMLKAMPLFLLTPWRFHYPERREPLFERLRNFGFETAGANAPGRSTFTFSRIVPPWMRPKLDWIVLRRMFVDPSSAAVVPARSSILSRRFSDHDFVTCVARV